MTALIVIIHIIVCLALILIVLLQTGKGADMGAVFGGAGSQTLFGSTGATTFLTKLTTIAAIVFMLTSLSLAYIGKSGNKSIVSDVKTESQMPPQQSPLPGPVPQEQQAAPAQQPTVTQPEAAPPVSPGPASKPAEQPSE